MASTEIQTVSRGGDRPDPPTVAELVATLRTLSRALQELLVAQARATGIPLLEFLILIRAAEGDGVIARDAGRVFRLNTSTMTGVTDRLEGDKLIRRAPHPNDRRLLVLQATAKGRKAVERALGPLLGQLAELTDALGEDQRQNLASFLEEASELVLQQANAARSRPSRRAVARVAAAR